MDSTRPFRVVGPSEVLRSDWSGDRRGYNGGRSSKPTSPEEGGYLATLQETCWACNFAHPPNILVYNDRWKVAQEEDTLRIGSQWIAQHGPPVPGNVRDLFSHFAPFNAGGAPRLRLMHNAYPAERLGHLTVAESLVCVANHQGHNADCSQCPSETVTAMFECFKIVSQYAAACGLTPVPIINGGRQRISGVSSPCAHVQMWLLDGEPPLYRRMLARRDELGHCALCSELRRPELKIPVKGLSTLRVIAHPTPERSWSLLIAPVECLDSLSAADSAEWAVAYSAAVRGLERRLGSMPAYNFFIRVGAGHVHAEIMPRNTNIPGAVEKATRLATVDVKPVEARAGIAEALELW